MRGKGDLPRDAIATLEGIPVLFPVWTFAGYPAGSSVLNDVYRSSLMRLPVQADNSLLVGCLTLVGRRGTGRSFCGR